MQVATASAAVVAVSMLANDHRALPVQADRWKTPKQSSVLPGRAKGGEGGEGGGLIATLQRVCVCACAATTADAVGVIYAPPGGGSERWVSEGPALIGDLVCLNPDNPPPTLPPPPPVSSPAPARTHARGKKKCARTHTDAQCPVIDGKHRQQYRERRAVR